jgi:hypothetical protein
MSNLVDTLYLAFQSVHTVLTSRLLLMPFCRTLRTAEDAAEGCEKWVFQLWLCTGLPRRPPIDGAAAAARQMAQERKGSSPTKKQKRPSKKKK